MLPPDYLVRKGIRSLPTLGDGRQSGTSDSPSILNVSPESAVGGGLSWLKTGDRIRIDLNTGRCDALVEDAEVARRLAECQAEQPRSNTPWEQLYRSLVGQLRDGAVLEQAVTFHRISEKAAPGIWGRYPPAAPIWAARLISRRGPELQLADRMIEGRRRPSRLRPRPDSHSDSIAGSQRTQTRFRGGRNRSHLLASSCRQRKR